MRGTVFDMRAALMLPYLLCRLARLIVIESVLLVEAVSAAPFHAASQAHSISAFAIHLGAASRAPWK